MPVDHDRPDVADQLRAFGETLQRAAREPITGGPALAPALPRRRHVLAVVGVAACLVAVVGGLVWIGRTRDSQTVAEPFSASSSMPSTTRTIPPTTTTLPRLREVVPPDPLGLASTGDWGLNERLEEDWRRSVTDDCPAVQEQSALNGRPTVYERYSATNAVSLDLDVTFLDAGTLEAALAVSNAYTERLQCDGAAGRVELPERVRALSSVAVGGFRIGEEFAVIAVAGPGNVVVTFELEAEGVTDALIEELVQRAAAFLGRTPNVNPYKLTPAVDDPLDLVVVVQAAGRYEPEASPYSAAIGDVLGRPAHEVSAAAQAARVGEAQLCLAADGFSETERSWRFFPGMQPVPSGYADTIIDRLAEPDVTDGQAGLQDAADRCWERALDAVTDPAAALAERLPSVTADAADVAAAEARHKACLAGLGYLVDPSVPIDRAFFEESMAIERSVNDGTITREEALAQLRVLQVAEEADVARRAPCDDGLDGQVQALIVAEQLAVLDTNPELLQPSAELTSAMAELQPYLDAVPD